MKVLFIGGNPKGYPEAFDEHTHSGKLLRKIVSELGIDAAYYDLWKDEYAERAGQFTQENADAIKARYFRGYKIVALGEKVYSAIIMQKGHPPIEPFPHPSRHSVLLRLKLKELIEAEGKS